MGYSLTCPLRVKIHESNIRDTTTFTHCPISMPAVVAFGMEVVSVNIITVSVLLPSLHAPDMLEKLYINIKHELTCIKTRRLVEANS